MAELSRAVLDRLAATIKAHGLAIRDLQGQEQPFTVARATLTAGTAPSMTAGANTRVNFSTVDLDPQGAITTGGSWVFTAPFAGYYLVTGSLMFTSAAWAQGDEVRMLLGKNAATNTALARWDSSWTGTQIASARGSDILKLAVGDVIYVNVFNGNAAARTLYSPAGTDGMNYTHLAIVKL